MENLTKIKDHLWKSSCSWWFAYPPNIYTTKKIDNKEYFNNLLYWSKNSLNKKVWLFIYIPFCDYFCNFCIYFKLNKTNINNYLNELVKEGKIHYIGISNETPWGVLEYLRIAEKKGYPRIATIQNQYSLINRTFEIGLAEMVIKEGIKY